MPSTVVVFLPTLHDGMRRELTGILTAIEL